MTFAEDLADWTDWDLAAFHLGRALGQFDGMNFHVDAKAVFWTDNPLGNGLHAALLALAQAGILDHVDRFRWSAATTLGSVAPCRFHRKECSCSPPTSSRTWSCCIRSTASVRKA